MRPHGLVELLKKLDLLQIHYEVDAGDWFSLSLKLAMDFVPGFSFAYDDPLAANLGLPRLGGSKSNRMSSAPWLWGPRLLNLVDMLHKAGEAENLCQSDKACAEFIYDAIRPQGRVTQQARLSGIRTIQRKIAKAKLRELGAARAVSERTESRGIPESFLK